MTKLNLMATLPIALGLLSTSASASKITIPFNDSERITAKISNKSMNRLSVEGDRIQEVIGIPDSVSVEKDSQHGHMFIKVPEASHDKVEVTLITEGGLVQDLTLEPVNTSSTTIVLQTDNPKGEGHTKSGKSGSHHSHLHSPEPDMAPSIQLANTSYQETLIDLLKTLFTGRFRDEGFVGQRTPSIKGVNINYNGGFKRSGLVGEVFEVTNASSESLDLQEKDFYEAGDLALALSTKSVPVGQKTTLYVVRRDL